MTEYHDCDLKKIEYTIALHFALAQSRARSNVSYQTETNVNTSITQPFALVYLPYWSRILGGSTAVRGS